MLFFIPKALAFINSTSNHLNLLYLLMGKRQRANTAKESRWLADDGLPWSDLYMYTHKLITRKLPDGD
jgi:hypothetical protein